MWTNIWKPDISWKLWTFLQNTNNFSIFKQFLIQTFFGNRKKLWIFWTFFWISDQNLKTRTNFWKLKHFLIFRFFFCNRQQFWKSQTTLETRTFFNTWTIFLKTETIFENFELSCKTRTNLKHSNIFCENQYFFKCKTNLNMLNIFKIL